jgi:hypothetical protein
MMVEADGLMGSPNIDRGADVSPAMEVKKGRLETFGTVDKQVMYCVS